LRYVAREVFAALRQMSNVNRADAA